MITRPAFSILPVRAAEDLAAIVDLFEDYAASLDIDLRSEGFGAELAGLPGEFAAPAGELLLARMRSGPAVGCIALRPLGGGTCEIKRLYVRPEGRGLGVGGALAKAVIASAERRGYREIKLDTLPALTAAIGLYHALGFRPIPPYGPATADQRLFFGKALGP